MVQKRLNTIRFQVLTGVALLSVVGCGSPDTENPADGVARIKTVAIPQTAIRNQDAAGFCWAYAAVGFLESKYRSETSTQLNLSEEALAFYRVVDELSYYAKMYRSDEKASWEDLVGAVRGSEFQGWIVRRSAKESDIRDAYELMEAYGVVPESSWNVKFSTAAKTSQMVRKVQDGFLTLLRSKGRSATVTEAELVRVVGKAFGSVPPTHFSVNGRDVTSVEFTTKILGFKASNYVLIAADNSKDVERIITATKQSLAKGLSVPIGFGVNFSLLKEGTFTYANKSHAYYEGIAQEKAKAFFARDGGHAVLITDFVNAGGREGAVPMSELRAQVGSPVENLSYLKIKNSWGVDASSNERGTAIRGSQDGYYRLDLGFLKGNADAGFLSVVVPSDIAAELQ